MSNTTTSPLVQELCDAALYVIATVLREIEVALLDDPETALEELRVGQRRKIALRIDVVTEDSFAKYLRRYRDRRLKDIKIYGEEKLRDPALNLAAEIGVVALVDAVDGTDLLERGLSNWCLALVFFQPSAAAGKRILAAFVGFPSGEIYYATTESEGALVRRGRSAPVPVRGPSRVTDVGEASVCFYGQKIANLASLIERRLVVELARRDAESRKATKDGLRLRIYNLAGNPLMARLIDHRVAEARGIDVVLDVEGQKPHDFVPGAYIAKKGGAVLKDLEKNEISYTALEEALLTPANPRSEFKYVIASTPQLCDDIVALLAPLKDAVVSGDVAEDAMPSR